MLRDQENTSDENGLILHLILNTSAIHLFSGQSYVGVRKAEPYKGLRNSQISDWNNGVQGLNTQRNL